MAKEKKRYKARLNNWSSCILFIQRKVHELDELAKSPKGTGADHGRVLEALKVLHTFMETRDSARIEEKFDELKRLRQKSSLGWGEEDEQTVQDFLKANAIRVVGA
ncbi:MAG: hypothetical protein AB1424_08950 [Thermodesulfobacteriota bacterium]